MIWFGECERGLCGGGWCCTTGRSRGVPRLARGQSPSADPRVAPPVADRLDAMWQCPLDRGSSTAANDAIEKHTEHD